MSFWDREYHNLAYPKVIIDPSGMRPDERSFYNELVDAVANSLDIVDLVVEQRNGDYRTVVYGSWDNDFLRYHFGSDGFWVSVRMSRELMNEYQDSPLFAAQENKRQFHWRSSVKPGEINQIGDIIAESATYFLGALNGGGGSKANGNSQSSEMAQKPVGDAKALPDTAVRDLEVAWALSGGDKQKLKTELSQSGYQLYYSREITLAGTNHYKAALKLKGGEVLTCKSEEDNPYDNTAVTLCDKDASQVGYLPKSEAKEQVFEALQSGCEIIAIVTHRGARAGSKRDRTHIMLITAS